MDHLIAEKIEYVKNQEVEHLTDENSSSQNDVNDVNHELIDFVKDKNDIGLTQDLQKNVESVQSVSVATKNIEGKIGDYSVQHSVTSPHEGNIQDIDINDIIEMPDISTRITDDQEIKESMLEEDEKDMDLTQESQEDFAFRDVVEIELTEGKVDNYY